MSNIERCWCRVSGGTGLVEKLIREGLTNRNCGPTVEIYVEPTFAGQLD